MDRIRRSSSIDKVSESDRHREKKLYEYLLTLTNSERDREGKYKENQIAAQWGMSDNRMFVRRVVRSIEPEKYPTESHTIPGITLNKLVHILQSIDKYRQEGIKSQKKDPKFPQILTRAEKLRAIRLYAKLLPNEREALDLKENENELLLQQLVENITDPYKGLSTEQISQICKDILDRSDLPISINSSENYDLDAVIEDSINKIAAEYFQYLGENWLEKLKETVSKNVKDVILDIEYQNGSYQLRKYLEDERRDLFNNYRETPDSRNKKEESIKVQEEEIYKRFSPAKFIGRLTKSIIENELLTQYFPIYIKYIEFKEVQSLHIFKNGTHQDSERVFAYTVRVYFYFKNSKGEKIDFYEDATGIGSPLSHAIAAINRALLWDIPSLKDYIPIAKEIMIDHEIIAASTNGSVWSHYIVSLCKRSEITDALANQKESCQIEDIAYSDYCGFDILEVSAKAAFYARLRAINQIGISPPKYINELEEKIEKVKKLRKGEKLLNEYPFSLAAMRSFLMKELLENCYEQDSDGCPIPESVTKDLPWSLIAYEAHLSITEAYLKEGLYAVGKKYLDCIKPHIDKYEGNPINKIIIARYHLCYFRYHYLTDLDDDTSFNRSRAAAITNANESLDVAYEHLKDYVHKCNLIDELPHINFYDFFKIMSKLYAHRAKLHFFMSTYQTNASIDEPIKLFEEASMYAARSGDPSLYSMWSAYQSWCCLVGAYEEYIDQQEEYIKKAEDLLIYALKSYEKTGNSCYESIKLASGKVTIGNNDEKKYYEKYGDIKIESIPLIYEAEGSGETSLPMLEKFPKAPLTINMSFLRSNLHLPETKTLLFGTQASMLIFAIGMLKLCQKHGESSLKAEIETARKMFNYSWSFAENGLDKNEAANEKSSEIKLDRVFDIDNNDKELISNFLPSYLEGQYLQGLYPHRLTQFADFGKIYFVVCEIILVCQLTSSSDEDKRWKYIENLLKKLRENKISPNKNLANQKRYNGHLQEHFVAIGEYVNSFKKQIETAKQMQLTEVRNIVVRDIAKIMRTGQKQACSLSCLAFK
jgi:hypothetical protein